MELSPEISAIAARVNLLLMDCDGVMTDGRLYFSADGEALKVFHVRDGQGLASWHKAGFASGIISGRDAREIIGKRAAEIGIKYVYTSSEDKSADFLKIIADAGTTADRVAYIGDDLGDIELMKLVGLPIAVADAAAETIEAAKLVTTLNGGCGAVRQVTDMLLAAKA